MNISISKKNFKSLGLYGFFCVWGRKLNRTLKGKTNKIF